MTRELESLRDPEWDIIPYQYQSSVNLFSTAGMATVRDDKIFPRNYTDPDGKRLVSVYMKRKSTHNGLPRNSASLDESSPSMADPMLQMPVSASQVYYKPSTRPVSIAIGSDVRGSEPGSSLRLKSSSMSELIEVGTEEEEEFKDDGGLFQCVDPRGEEPGWSERVQDLGEQQQQNGEGTSVAGTSTVANDENSSVAQSTGDWLHQKQADSNYM